jgi:hypothetical protein
MDIMNRGLVVMLLTDLKTTFIMDSDDEIGDFLQLGGARNEAPAAFLLLKLNPLVNSLLRHIDEPIELKIDRKTYSLLRRAQGGLSVKSPEELLVLKALRDRSFSYVSAETKDGKIIRLDAGADHKNVTTTDLIALVDNAKYQTVQVTMQDGKIVKLHQRKPIFVNRAGRGGVSPSGRVRNRKPG